MDSLRNKALLLLLLYVYVPAFGATFIGRVISDRGRPVSSVTVSMQATVAAVSNGATVQPLSYLATTDSQGVYSVTLPNTGAYSICVGSPAQQLLNSCEWNLAQSVVQVGAQPAAIHVVVLQTGIPVNIRLDDPNSLLPKPGIAGTAGVTFVVLESSGHSHLTSQLSADNKGFNYQILVPLGASNLRFSVQARNVNVVDQSNALVSTGLLATSSILNDLSQVLYYKVVAKGN